MWRSKPRAPEDLKLFCPTCGCKMKLVDAKRLPLIRGDTKLHIDFYWQCAGGHFWAPDRIRKRLGEKARGIL